MSEFREDPITGRWRVLAEGRSVRPNEYASRPAPPREDDCPFCEGREDRTPPEVAAVRPAHTRADGPGWSVRAIPNKFPTVTPLRVDARPPAPSPFLRRPGAGVHEVVLESPAHSPTLPYLAPPQLQRLFRFLRDRVHAVAAEPSIGSVLLFENQGPESGGTLTHPHAQLVATDLVPPRLREEAERFGIAARARAGACLLESAVAAESEAHERVISSDEHFVAYAPFASEYPYETWIVPRRHAPSFAAATDAEVDRLAELLPAVLRALEAVRPGASYNWFVHGWEAPLEVGGDFHWHVEVAPRLVRADGYELGTGVPVNPVAPERAAADLREALP